jgi:hypothetical protein
VNSALTTSKTCRLPYGPFSIAIGGLSWILAVASGFNSIDMTPPSLPWPFVGGAGSTRG